MFCCFCRRAKGCPGNLSDQTLTECKNSYDRTMSIVGAGLEEANAYYAQHQQEVEAALGVKNDG